MQIREASFKNILKDLSIILIPLSIIALSFFYTFKAEATDPLIAVDDLEILPYDNGQRIRLDWDYQTGNSDATHFYAKIYTGEMTDQDFIANYDNPPSASSTGWREISDYHKKDGFLVGIGSPHVVGLYTKNSQGEVSDLSNIAHWHPDDVAIDPVDDLEAYIASNGMLRLTWTPVPNSTLFDVYLYTGEITDHNFVELFGENPHSSRFDEITDENIKNRFMVPAEDPHVVVVYLRNDQGEMSLMSNIYQWVPEGTTVDAADDLEVVQDEGGSIYLDWTDVPLATHFAVVLYTGEMSDADFLAQYDNTPDPGDFDVINDSTIWDSFRVPASEPHVVAIYLMNQSSGLISGISNIARWIPGQSTLPEADFIDPILVNIESYQNPFPDTDLEEVEGKAASELYRRNVLNGYPDGEFKGDRYVNRAEAAKFLLLTRFGSVAERDNNGQFSDIPDEAQWYTKYVVTAANLEIINGYPDGTFKPEETVNTAEFLKMLTLTFDLDVGEEHGYLDVDEDQWFDQYAATGQIYYLFPNRDYNYLEPARLMTRDEVAVAIYQYLDNKYNQYDFY